MTYNSSKYVCVCVCVCVCAHDTGLDLPPALTRTWGLGVIRTVQGQASRSLHALTCEMFAWQVRHTHTRTCTHTHTYTHTLMHKPTYLAANSIMLAGTSGWLKWHARVCVCVCVCVCACVCAQAESRRSATSLLRTMLALSGDATHQHAQTLVPALCR